MDRIPFAALEGWSFRPDTGNLAHRSGRFFTVEGLHVTEEAEPHGDGPYADWYQPVISQPEVGVLGLLVRDIGGVPHFLMQAKMEPGNPNLLQLAPTLQATRSNYTRAHRGGRVRYLEHFVGPGRGRVLADVLQSEHDSWFFRKSNRIMVVEGERPASRVRPTPAGERHGGAAAGRTRRLAQRGLVAVDQFLRGVCYSAGTAPVGLLVLWMAPAADLLPRQPALAWAEMPPSTGIAVPVTNEARGLHSQAAASAISRGSAIRF